MREIVNFNRKWAFAKGVTEAPAELPKLWDFVNLPHTWNGIDGQDGGGDYYRGPACYAKAFQKTDLPQAESYYLEINGANSSADVYLNGKHLRHHDGGYSTWRVDVTEALDQENLLAIVVGLEFVRMLIDTTPTNILEVLTVAITRHVVLSHDDPWSNVACIACIAGLFAIRRYLVRRSELNEEMVEVKNL